MKMVKSLLLGSAASIAAIAGAQAADLPVKAKPVEYVKVCSLYGAGYYYIPGTQTCIRIGGFLRMNVGINNMAQYTPIYNGPNGALQRDRAFISNSSRAASQIDIRSNTDYGVLRTYVYSYLNVGSNAAVGPTLLIAYTQLAGFTVGKFKSSFYAPWSTGGTGSLGVFRPDDASTSQGIEYKWELGGGLSASLGVFDPRRTGVYDRADTTMTIGSFPNSQPALGVQNSGYHMPDIQANVRIEQAWGGFHVGAKVQEVTVLYNGTNSPNGSAATGAFISNLETTGAPKTKYGWAVNASLNLKNLPTGASDQIWATVGYARGSMNSLYSSTPGTSWALFGPGRGLAYNTVAWGYLLDGVFDSNVGGFTQGQIQLTEGWSASLLYEHWWLPAKLKSGFYGNYAAVNYNEKAKASICTSTGLGYGTAAGVNAPTPGQNRFYMQPGSVCDPNWQYITVGSNSTWYPARDFEITVDVAWSKFDTAMSGVINHPAPSPQNTVLPAGKPGGFYEIADQSTMYATVNILRTW